MRDISCCGVSFLPVVPLLVPIKLMALSVTLSVEARLDLLHSLAFFSSKEGRAPSACNIQVLAISNGSFVIRIKIKREVQCSLRQGTNSSSVRIPSGSSIFDAFDAHFQSLLHPYISPFNLLPISSLTCPMHRPTIFLLLLSVSLPTSSLASSTCRDKDEVAVQTLMPNSNGCSKPPGMEVGGEEVSDRCSFSPRSG